MTEPRTRLLVCAALLLTSLCAAHASCATAQLTALRDACALGGVLRVASAAGGRAAVGPGSCDRTFDKRAFAHAPTVKYEAADKEALYTLVMVDPDAPNHATGRFYLHWILADLPGSQLAAGRVDGATVVSTYLGPGPPKGTGPHRYMFAVYEQRARAVDPTAPAARAQFDLDAWLRKQSAQLCGPVAGAQFRAHF